MALKKHFAGSLANVPSCNNIHCYLIFLTAYQGAGTRPCPTFLRVKLQMSILYKLKNEYYWRQFLKSKQEGGHLSSREEKKLDDFITNKKYLPVVENVLNKKPFALPKVTVLNKKHSSKKRTVFVFDQEENTVLKLLGFLLNKYDNLFSKNLYSFRKDVCVKTAVCNLLKSTKNTQKWGYKADIHDYFNSVDTQSIINLLTKSLPDDKLLTDFITSILTEPNCIKNGQIVTLKKGIMAGVPISGFLANLYLKEMDEWFLSREIPYARYSDDVIVFTDTQQELNKYERVIKDFLSSKKLEINPKKEVIYSPDQPWEFLGFSIRSGCVDISKIALEKIKDKMRRKAKALARWKKRNNADGERASRAFIRHFNKKFFDNPHQNDITWCRWYFPTITTDKSLHIIDEFMVDCIRYIATGKRTKARYNLRYEQIKEWGYRSLVNEYYKCKKST